MKKKTKINRYYILVVIFFLIILPIFISYNSINDFSFNIISTVDVAEIYKFILPISFFFIVPFILLGLGNFYRDFEIFLLLVLILLSFFVAFLTENFTHVELLFKIVSPILTLLGFEIFFKKKLLSIGKIDKFQVIKKINLHITLIFVIIFFITMISPLYLDKTYNWLVNEIVIYSYHQYYSLIFIFLLGLLIINKQKYLFFLIYILSFYQVNPTTNDTFFLFLILIGIYYIINLLFSYQKKDLIYITKIFIIFSFFSIILYPIIIFYFYEELIKLDIPVNISGRFNHIFYFFKNVTFLELLTPVRIYSQISNKFYHNEFIVITSALGICGSFLFYFVMLKRILFINKYYPQISFMLSLYCLLSGIVLTTNLHPYTFIISSFFISYYYVLSKFQSQKFVSS
jgi:hypothetical protein